MNFDLIKVWTDLAVTQYHVDPAIFVFLMLASIPPYYLGWYGILREIVSFGKRYGDKKNKLKITDILSERGFLLPLSINRAAWVMPYIYVIFWGKNIPLWFWILFFGWIILSGFLFWNKIKQQITEPVKV